MTTPRQPGWYDDPQDANAQRYWDGQDWTPHRQRKPVAPQAQEPVKSTPPTPPPTSNAPPPPPPPSNAPPPPPPPTSNVPPPPPTAPRSKSRAGKVGFVLAGLALVLVIAALVAGRVALGTFLPGILLVAAIAIIGVIFTLRSHQSGLRKAVVVTAIVLVVAAAVPASLKGVYPVYHHFFEKGSAQASRGGNGGSGSGAEAPSSGSAAQVPKSGILVASGNAWDEANFGYIDPTSGKYTQVSSFNVKLPDDPDFLELSPDLTKLATIKSDSSPNSVQRVGWIDTRGNFTAVSPAPPATADFPRSLPPTYQTPVFDGAGNFYYWALQGNNNAHLYKLAAGSTSNPQEVTPTPRFQSNPLRNIDGTLNFGCQNMPGKWLGPDYRVTVTVNIGLPTSPTNPSSSGFVIAKYPIEHNGEGCPVINQNNQNAVEIFDLGVQNANQPVTSPDNTKLAFFNSNQPGGLYVVGVEANSKATRIDSLSDLNLPNLKLFRWS